MPRLNSVVSGRFLQKGVGCFSSPVLEGVELQDFIDLSVLFRLSKELSIYDSGEELAVSPINGGLLPVVTVMAYFISGMVFFGTRGGSTFGISLKLRGEVSNFDIIELESGIGLRYDI